jgi:ketopantoate reductase
VHVAIVGAGALGRVYGVRLAKRSPSSVTLVVRKGRVMDRSPLRIVRIDGDGAADVWEEPTLATDVPGHTDVILVTVRVEQLDASLDGLLESSAAAPVVVLTPMMPPEFERLRSRHGTRILAAMAGVVAYVNAEGVCRYWLPRLAPTLIDEPRPPVPVVLELVKDLETAGIAARLDLGVHESNPATTVTLMPLALGIDAAGSIDALLADRALSGTALAAVREGMELSRRIGKAAVWVDAFASYAGPTMLKIGAALARRRYPEAFAYVEDHFGRKLHAQNVVMGRAIVDLAKAKGTPHEALDTLLERLERIA